MEETNNVVEYSSLEEAMDSLGLSLTPPQPQEPAQEEQPQDLYQPVDPFNKYVDQASLRYSGAPWFEVASNIRHQDVTIVGVGGIGSNLAYSLSRIGIPRITIYDNDKVELLNLAGQFYDRTHVGLYKVHALHNILANMSPSCYIQEYIRHFLPNTSASRYMFTGLDNMEARKFCFQSWKAGYASDKNAIFIDGRLSFDTIQIFAIPGRCPNLIKIYEDKYLFNDDQAEETICSMKQTTFMASMIGAMMTNIFINFLINTTNPIIEASVPFKTVYDSNLMMFL